MFEFIGIAFVCWLIFAFIRGIMRAKGTSTSKEYGLETRRIATQEMFIPNQYYNFIVTNHMDDLKKQALVLKDNGGKYEKTSWPRLLALGMLCWFHRDCLKFHNGDQSRIQLFRQINIEPHDIATMLMEDINTLLERHA